MEHNINLSLEPMLDEKVMNAFLVQLALLQNTAHGFNYPLTVYGYAPARQIVDRWQSSGPLFMRIFRENPRSIALTRAVHTDTTPQKPIRIGIVGGGIAGVSVARALTQRLPSDQRYDIVVFEQDSHSGATKRDKNMPPQWTAATARNANSLVPGAAMHVFSRSSVVWDVIKDTVSEWYLQQKERVSPKGRANDFAIQPPYFSLNLIRCLGPSASSVERWSFVRFLSNFLYSALWLSDDTADRRGRQLCELAKANRAIYLNEVGKHKELLESDTGHSRGFLSLYRELGTAEKAVKEAMDHGEPAELLDWESAVERAPQLKNLPVAPLYGVLRPDDFTSSCETFIRHWIKEITQAGVRYDHNKIDRVIEGPADGQDDQSHYTVVTEDGSETKCDVLVLAAGVNTPLLASQLGVSKYCPTYPFRGFSLTVFARDENTDHQENNLLLQPFTVDAMYCSSVTPSMVRLAGFGEFVGYRDKAQAVPSIGPSVLVRYVSKIFPEVGNVTLEEVLPCFRPLSPDDLPLAGEVVAKPNLFLHTGHGTLGWTVGLASGDCVAQAIVDKLENRLPSESFTLPNDTKIDRNVLSPNRFA